MISTTDDNVVEGDHDFTVMLDSATPTIGAPSSATASLLDNDSVCLAVGLWFGDHSHYSIDFLIYTPTHVNPASFHPLCNHTPHKQMHDIPLFRCLQAIANSGVVTVCIDITGVP